MKIYPKKNYEGWYPIIYTEKTVIALDMSIASLIHSNSEEYCSLLLRYGALLKEYGHFFNTKEQCQDFIDSIIIPRLILKEL